MTHVKLKHGKITFSSREEFFETLGILCRNDGTTKIRGKRSTATATKVVFQPGQPLKELSNSFYIDCSQDIYFTKALYDIMKENSTNRIGCADYIRYLSNHFHFEYDMENTAIDIDGSERLSRILSPPINEISDLISEKYDSTCLYFFKKGLYAKY